MTGRYPAGPVVRRRVLRWCAGVAVLVLAVSGLAACSTASSGSSITLYNGQHPQTTDALVAAFTKATGIRVNVRSDDEGVLVPEILAEGSHTPADVIYTENSPALEELQDHGLLTPAPRSVLGRTPSKFNSPQGDWVGVSARVSVLVYNPSLISRSDLPTSVLALADSRYRGRLAFAPSETDFQPVITSVLNTYGKATTLRWLEGIKANSSGHLVEDNEVITADVNRGEVAFGLVNQYYWYRLRADLGASGMHSAIAYFAPRDPGYVLDVSGAAVLKSAANRADAEKFLAFLTSRQGQEIIAHGDSFEYPIASGVTTAAPETPFADLQPNPVTVAQLGNGAAAVALLQEAQLL